MIDVRCPLGFEPRTITFRREWRRRYVLTVSYDWRLRVWDYRVDRKEKHAASIGVFYQEIGKPIPSITSGDGFKDPEVAASAAMIAARIDYSKRPRRK